MAAAVDPQNIHVLSIVDYLPILGCYASNPRMLHGGSASVHACRKRTRRLSASMHACRSKHAGEGNQFMGVVELPEGAIVELKTESQ